MEEFLARFPGLGRKIFNQLDNQDLIKCKEISRYQCKFLEDDRLVWTRMIKKYNANHVEFKDAWKLVLEKVPVEIVKEIAIATEQFYTDWPRVAAQHQHSPHHIAGEYGCLPLCKFIVQKTRSLNPAKPDEFTGLHYAANMGHYEVCKFFIANLDNKNPKDEHGFTLLHHAGVFSNHVDIYKLIADQVEDKNPADADGNTILHEAVWRRRNEIVRYIMSVQPENPRNNDGFTPLHYAADEGCLDIYKVIAERLDDKYPLADDGHLPIHYAALFGHYEICKFIIENGGDPNPALNNGTSALELAGSNEIIRDLILQKSKENQTPNV